MSRNDRAEELALQALVARRQVPSGFTRDGFALLAADRSGSVAGALLASRVPRHTTVRAWFFVFEAQDSGWTLLFDHNDAWVEGQFERPASGPPLAYATSIRGDATRAGDPVMAFAGVATAAVQDVTIETARGGRSVAIDPSTGAFIVVALGPRIDLALRANGTVLQELRYTAPAGVPERR